jgi:imidazolonepropionase
MSTQDSRQTSADEWNGAEFVVENARVYSMQGSGPVPTRLVPDAESFRVAAGRIVEIPASGRGSRRVDLAGRIVLPGFVDCHTHALFAGDRQDEFAARLAGDSYEAIAHRGGGIRATVAAVARTPDAELVDLTVRRVAAFAAEGVTTVEIKSGYGLELEAELRCLRLIRRVSERARILVEPTCLAAHALPAGRGRADYVAEILNELLPRVASEQLARTIDVYIEGVAFDAEEASRIFDRARSLGLAVRAHVEQFSRVGGALAATRARALSCDHLEHANDADVRALKAAGTVAFALPGAFYCLRETALPPIAALRSAGVPIAIASDFNPGTSPLGSLLVALHFGVVLFGLTATEALYGVTRNAAAALGRLDDFGTLAPGKLANFAVWDLPSPEHLAYQLGGLRPDAVYVRGIEL